MGIRRQTGPIVRRGQGLPGSPDAMSVSFGVEEPTRSLRPATFINPNDTSEAHKLRVQMDAMRFRR